MDRPIWHQILRINYKSVSTIYSISNFPMSISLSILYQTLIPVAWAVGLIQDGNRCRATGGGGDGCAGGGGYRPTSTLFLMLGFHECLHSSRLSSAIKFIQRQVVCG